MTPRTAKPLLLVDVDGPLNPWTKITRKGHQAAEHYTKHRLRPRGWEDVKGRAPLQVLLSTEHGESLRDLSSAFTLIWATTWMEDANRLISPILGLPTSIPVIEWPAHALDTHPREGRNGSWKTPWIARWLDNFAPGLPWAWLDDEVNRYDRAWFEQWYATHERPPHLLQRIDHNIGLVQADFDTLREFADSLA
jgi:hypothetical protein